MTSGDRVPAAPRAAPGVLRVHWIPGTDQLLGTCHCGAEHTALDPVELWDWLHAHPVGHRRRPGDPDRQQDPDPHADQDPDSAGPGTGPARRGRTDAHRVLTVR
jgi:hypothetical protein